MILQIVICIILKVLASSRASVETEVGLGSSSVLMVLVFSSSTTNIKDLTFFLVPKVFLGPFCPRFGLMTNPASWRAYSLLIFGIGFDPVAGFGVIEAFNTSPGLGLMGCLTLTIVPSGFRTLTISILIASLSSFIVIASLVVKRLGTSGLRCLG